MRKLLRRLRRVTSSARRLAVYLLVVLLAYLLQACLMPHIRIGSVSPSLLYAVAAVITVCYGRLRAYWTGAIFGILTEITMPTLSYFNLLIYPIAITFSAVFFADKSEKRLEEDRSQGKAAGNGNVYVRTLADATLCTVLNEDINITYMYLGGAPITLALITRGLLTVGLTVALTAVIMWPLRTLLGFRRPPREEKRVTGRYLKEA